MPPEKKERSPAKVPDIFKKFKSIFNILKPLDISALIKRLELKLMALPVAVIFICCSENIESILKPQSNSINKILPLGASIVEGASPYYESFRYELWKKLSENDWIFDFIGTQSDPASYPNLGSLSFDVDHEGRGGWTSADI